MLSVVWRPAKATTWPVTLQRHDEAIFDAARPLVFKAIPDLGVARPHFSTVRQ